MPPLRSVQMKVQHLRTISAEDELKSALAEVMAATPLLLELAMSMKVACEDLHKAKKERLKRQRKAERDEKTKKARERRRQKKEAEQLEKGAKETQRKKAEAAQTMDGAPPLIDSGYVAVDLDNV